MDTRTSFSSSDSSLVGLRLMAVLPLSRKDRTKYIYSVLAAAKARWNWNIDVVCQVTDRRPFEKLVAPSGKLYSPPHLLKVADWERDPSTAAAVVERVHESELAANLPIGRMVLAGAHSVGRAFNLKLRYSNRYPLVQRMSRQNLEPFRVYRRLFKFCDDAIVSANPDLIFALDWSTPIHSSLWLAANLRGIPCVALRNSKIIPNHAFWTTDRLLLNTVALEDARLRRRDKSPVSDAARNYIEAFRNKPRTIDYIANKWRDRMRRGFWRWHLEYARTVVRELINTTRGQDRALREPGIVRLYRYYRGLFLSYYHRRFLSAPSENTLAQMKYVYFPLHKEAELAQTFQATLWHDQPNTVRVLASMLPAGYRLLVREHRLNYSLRPTRVYRQLSTLPNVVLIDPFDSQFKYLRHADLIVTENGSSGWEGILLGRPVVTLAPTFYDGAERTTKVLNPHQLNSAILNALAKPEVSDAAEHDHALGCMVAAEMENSFAMGGLDASEALDLLATVMGPELASRAAQPEKRYGKT